MNSNNSSQKAVIDYDFFNDSLFIYFSEKSVISTSKECKEFIFDFDNNNNMIGIEILNASKKFNSSKENLRTISHFSSKVKVAKEKIEIKVRITSRVRNSFRETKLNLETLNTDMMRPFESSLALET